VSPCWTHHRSTGERNRQRHASEIVYPHRHRSAHLCADRDAWADAIRSAYCALSSINDRALFITSELKVRPVRQSQPRAGPANTLSHGFWVSLESLAKPLCNAASESDPHRLRPSRGLNVGACFSVILRPRTSSCRVAINASLIADGDEPIPISFPKSLVTSP
jgi:hypothetical protein